MNRLRTNKGTFIAIHGLRENLHYARWHNMIKRCNDPADKSYSAYGGRGIKVCDEWLSINNFVTWAENSGYRPGLSLDRIDNDGDYSPDNCRWSTHSEQMKNRRSFSRSLLTHCKRGHEYNEENTRYYNKNSNARYCNKCRLIRESRNK